MKQLKKYFRSEIRKQHSYQLRSYPQAIKLNQNELPYDFSLKMKREVLRRLEKVPFQDYPLVQPFRLRKALAKELKVKPNQILVANGSNVLIQTITLSAAVGKTVMALDPTFSLYELAAKGLGNRFVKVPLKAPDFRFDVKDCLKKLRQTRPNLTFIANPNAPTGNLIPTEDLLEVIEKAPGLVVVDEAYHHFSKVSLVPYLKKFPNLMVLQTFSKALGMGGVRVGYMVARPEVVEEVEKVLLPYCVNRLSEETALVALEHQKHFEKIVQEVSQERERVFQALQVLPKVKVYPSVANFLLFRVDNAKACFQHLLKKGILVRDVSATARLKGCLRVTIGKRPENNAFLRAIKAY